MKELERSDALFQEERTAEADSSDAQVRKADPKQSNSVFPEVVAQKKLRGDVENQLAPLEAAYRASPGNDQARRAYAEILFQLGNIWQANDVIAPLATSWSSNIADLELGGKLALLTSDYDRAEALYERLRAITRKGSAAHTAALKGLVMVYYQSNQYAKAKGIELPEEDDQKRGIAELLMFMKRFKGTPYRIEWATQEKVAHLPIINDFTRLGALPMVKLEINGHTVEFILDTGGDRLYLDESLARNLGIRIIAKRQRIYAYTKGEYVEELLGVAHTVKMGEVTLKNVLVIVAKWKTMGLLSDGVLTTQILKQFLSTVDYDNKRITFRERSERGKQHLMSSFGDKPPIRMPFFLASTHLMFTKGSLNGHQGMNMFVDSGLAVTMTASIVIPDETAEFLSLVKNPIPGSKYYWSPVKSHGLGDMSRGETQALGNVLVEENIYWQLGFLFDALISHQYLQHRGSWTIDFDTMSFYFPSDVSKKAEDAPATKMPAEAKKDEEKVGAGDSLKRYEGSYHSDMIRSDMTVRVSEGKLSLTASGGLQGSFTLMKTGEHLFEAENAPTKIVLEFKVDDDKVTGVNVTVSDQGPFFFKRSGKNIEVAAYSLGQRYRLIRL